MFGKADNQTQCCWVRSKRATSVLCSTPSPPLLCVLCYRSLESDHLFKASQAPNREPPKFFVRLTSRPFREKSGTVFLLLSGTKKVSDQAEPFPRRCSGQRRRQKNSGPGPPGGPIRPSTDRNVEDGSHFIETKDRRRNIFIIDICATLTVDHRGTVL